MEHNSDFDDFQSGEPEFIADFANLSEDEKESLQAHLEESQTELEKKKAAIEATKKAEFEEFISKLDRETVEDVRPIFEELVDKHEMQIEKDREIRIRSGSSQANLDMRDRHNLVVPTAPDTAYGGTDVDPELIAQIEEQHERYMHPRNVNDLELNSDNFDPAALDYLKGFTDSEEVWNQKPKED